MNLVRSVTGAILAAGILCSVYALPLLLVVVVAHTVPSINLLVTLDSVGSWLVTLLGFAFLFWFVELVGKWTFAQVSVWESYKKYAFSISFIVEVVLTASVFRLLIDSLFSAVVCSLLLSGLGLIVEICVRRTKRARCLLRENRG